MSSTILPRSRRALRYRPLLDGEIRLLRIPCYQNRDSFPQVAQPRLRYTLLHAQLSEVPKFIALSYCWGHQIAERPIILDDHEVALTESLATALDSLRHENEDVILWADALCINQEDPIERTAQVQLMRQIYKTATQVIMWLGPSNSGTDCMMQEIRKLSTQLISMGLWDLLRWDGWDGEVNPSSAMASSSQGISDLIEKHLGGVTDHNNHFDWITTHLAERPWWTRIWCVQECANAQVATLRCGQEEIDFAQYWTVARYLHTLSYNLLLKPANITTTGNAGLLAERVSGAFPTGIIEIRSRLLTGKEYTLFDLLLICNVAVGDKRNMGATDPRDRVYALLGIADDAAAKEIVADYTLSSEEAYIVTARVLLRHGYDEIFSLCCQRDVRRNLPSWVPDWSATFKRPWANWLGTRCFNASNSLDSGCSTFSTISMKDDRLSREILLETIFVDFIEEVGCVWSETKAAACVRESLNDVSKFIQRSNRYEMGEKEEAEWRIPIGDLQASCLNWQIGRAEPDSLLKVGHGQLRELAERQELPVEKDIKSDDGPFAGYLGAMGRKHDSRPFLSNRGYVGLCPMQAQPGDHIVVIIGARVPYILRKSEDGPYRTLVGESYVHGIMDGEIMKSDPPIEYIRLR